VTTLAPDIVAAILDETLPPDLTLLDLAVDRGGRSSFRLPRMRQRRFDQRREADGAVQISGSSVRIDLLFQPTTRAKDRRVATVATHQQSLSAIP
jgi:hypothetical protein